MHPVNSTQTIRHSLFLGSEAAIRPCRLRCIPQGSWLLMRIGIFFLATRCPHRILALRSSTRCNQRLHIARWLWGLSAPFGLAWKSTGLSGKNQHQQKRRPPVHIGPNPHQISSQKRQSWFNLDLWHKLAKQMSNCCSRGSFHSSWNLIFQGRKFAEWTQTFIWAHPHGKKWYWSELLQSA